MSVRKCKMEKVKKCKQKKKKIKKDLKPKVFFNFLLGMDMDIWEIYFKIVMKKN